MVGDELTRRISEFVQHAAFIAGAEDEHGNETEAWGDPVPVGIYALDPGGTSEPVISGHDRVITKPTIYVPDETVFSARDEVIARGLRYEVEGDTSTWRHPNGLRPGNVIELKRVDG